MIKWCWTISLSQAFQHRWRIGFQFDYVRCTDTHTNSHAIIRSAYRAWHKKSHSNTNATKYSIVYCNVFSHRISQGVLETWCGVVWICRHVEFVLCTFAWRTRLFFSFHAFACDGLVVCYLHLVVDYYAISCICCFTYSSSFFLFFICQRDIHFSTFTHIHPHAHTHTRSGRESETHIYSYSIVL